MKWFVLLSILFLAGIMPVLAAPSAETPPDFPPPPPPPSSEGKNGRGMFWMAFNSLDEAERREMMKLQSTNPEEFKRRLKIRAEEIQRRMTERFEHMKRLSAEFQKAEAERQKDIRRELENMLREDYRFHLNRGKRHVEEMKRRTERLERELEKRERMMDGAIQSQLEAILSGRIVPGELPPPPRGKNNPFRP